MEIGNLSNLSVQLQKVEVGFVKVGDTSLGDARLGLVNALESYRNSRYRLGQTLSAYRKFFLLGRGWIAAANIIASTIGCDERTIRRIVDDFDRVAGIPDIVIKALEQAGIDPSARKHAGIIAKVLRMSVNVNGSIPENTMLNAIQESKKVNRSGHYEVEHATPGMARNGQVRLAVRMKIRTALKRVPLNQRLAELVAALEEEMYTEWGQIEPVTVTITPRRSEAHDDDGGQRIAA